MKKGKFLLIFALLLTAVAVLSQVIDPEIPVPEKWTDLIDINAWFAGMNAVAGLTVFLSGALITYLFKPEKKWAKQLIAVLVAVILTTVSGLLNFGYMAGAPILALILYGVGCGFLANGWYDVETVRNLLKWLKVSK